MIFSTRPNPHGASPRRFAEAAFRELRSCSPRLLALALALVCFTAGQAQDAPAPSGSKASASSSTPSPGQPLSPSQLEALLPGKVYFQGQSASVQLRNAGGTRFADGSIVFAVMVDTSGYSTAVQQKYQFYLTTETDIRFGGQTLHPGAYGAGFVEGDRFVVMDIGGHTIAEGSTVNDGALQHPRPLQVRADRPDAVRLYLGRRYVLIEAAKL